MWRGPWFAVPRGDIGRSFDGQGGAAVWHFFDKCGITFKKDGACERVAARQCEGRRQAWLEGQLDLDPRRLVFINKTGASTKMARLRGRAPRGERYRAAWPLEDDHLYRRAAPQWIGRADGLGRAHERGCLPRLCRIGPRAGIEQGGRGHRGQLTCTTKWAASGQ